MNKILISQINPIGNSESSFPIFAKFYNSGRNLLEYKDGAVPFFINISSGVTDSSITAISDEISSNRRIAKGYIFDKFNVYEISDYGYQSLSPTFDDVLVLVYDSEGYKIPQKDVVLIKNFTTKKAYVLVPKLLIGNGAKIIIEPSSPVIKTFNLGSAISSDNGSFTFAMDSKSIDNLSDIEVYIEDGSEKYIIPNSDYFITKTINPLEKNLTKTFIERQETYFEKKQSNDPLLSKVYPSNTITISTDIAGTGKSFFISSKEYYTQSFYSGFSGSLFSNDAIRKEISYDVYIAEVSGKMKKLILGIDYYINNGEIRFVNITSGTIDVIAKKDEKLFIPFLTESTPTFTPQRALYDNHIFKWNVVLASSFVTIYEDGLLKGNHSYEIIANKNYEYIIEDISTIANGSAPTANSGISILSDISYTIPDIEKYQITTDPNFNTYGGVKESDTQEVYLYNKGQNFNINILEPNVEDLSTFNLEGERLTTVLKVQSFTDPYIASLQAVSNLYKAIQAPDSGKGTIADGLDTENVLVIENNIAQLKKNFKAILSNSSITYQDYTAQISNAGKFLFLIIKGTPEQRFNIIYKEGTTIIKKEYGCTIGSDGIFISIPFFLETFVSGGKSTIDFEIEQIGTLTSPQYHIFK